MSRISLFTVSLFRCLVINTKLKNVISLFGSLRKPKTDSKTLNMHSNYYVFKRVVLMYL